MINSCRGSLGARRDQHAADAGSSGSLASSRDLRQRVAFIDARAR